MAGQALTGLGPAELLGLRKELIALPQEVGSSLVRFQVLIAPGAGRGAAVDSLRTYVDFQAAAGVPVGAHLAGHREALAGESRYWPSYFVDAA